MIGTTDSECGGDPEKGLGGVAPFIERNPDNVTSTLERRRRVPHSQEDTQATSSRQQLTAEDRMRALMETEIQRVRQHYHEQEKVLEREIVKHQQRYELVLKSMESWGEEDDYPVADWWEVQSDYQPTECGN
jgi:hypothetical protein